MHRRNTSAGRSAGLCRFEFFAVGNAAADLLNDLAEGCSHGNFHETDVCDLSAECKDLGALGSLGSDGGIPLGSSADDLCDVGVSLNVIEYSGFLEETFHCRERRSGTRLAALAFDGSHQRCLFAADERACAEADLYVKVEAGSEDIFSEQSVFSGLLDRDLQSFYRDRVLGTHIYVTLAGADRVTCDRHSFQNCVRIAFQNRAVHECARVAFVGVAAYILDIGLGRLTECPFSSGGESGAAAAAEAGSQHHVDDLVLGHARQDLIECLIAVQRDVFLNIFRIDHAAVPQGDSHLLGIEIGLGKRKDLAVFMDCLRIEQILADRAFDDVLVDDALSSLRCCLGIESSLGIYDHDGAQCAEAKTSGLYNKDILESLFFDLVLECLGYLMASG